MTNSLLTTLNGSALKISLEDKHVGYVLYKGHVFVASASVAQTGNRLLPNSPT